MAGTNEFEGTQWFRYFSVKIRPNQDNIHLCKKFNAYCFSGFENNVVELMDPRGNNIVLNCAYYNNAVYLVRGGFKIRQAYSLKWEFEVCFFYFGMGLFHVRIFEKKFVEVRYPGPVSRIPTGLRDFNKSLCKTVNCTLRTNEETLSLGESFTFLWKDSVVQGDASIIDMEGNEFGVKISNDPEEVLVLHGGLSHIGEFYGMTTELHVWLHYMGANKFGMRIFTCNDIEVLYPIVIGDSDREDGAGELNANEYLSWDKRLTKSEVAKSQPLLIPACIARNVFKKKVDYIEMQHDGGHKYECRVMFGQGKRAKEVYLCTGWYQFIKENGLGDKNVARLWFTGEPLTLCVRILS